MLVYVVMGITMSPSFFFPAAMFAVMAFRGEMNSLYTMGPVYWITKRDLRLIALGVGTMHQTNSPWRKGRGVYLVLFKKCFQIGLSTKQHLNEIDGTLSAVQGRYLDVEPKEIGNWGVQEKDQDRKLTA